MALPGRLPEVHAADSVDVNWKHGTLVTPETPQEPTSLADDDGSIAALLDAAEDIVNAAGPGMMADVEAERAREALPRWKRIFKRERTFQDATTDRPGVIGAWGNPGPSSVG